MTAVQPAAVVEATQILIVDDIEANLVAIRSALEPLGTEIVEARSGREALRLLLDRDFSLILLDVQMPGLDGHETARLIRSRQRSRVTPIIFVTAHDRNDEAVLQGYALGAVDYLFKPIVTDVLLAKASVFVDLHRRTVEAQRQAEIIRELERSAARRRLDTERRQWESARLREENRRKDEFLAVLAHELRNPIAPIRLGLELLERYQTASGAQERQQRVIVRMRRQLEHMVRLVDDLLDISRITQGKITLRKSLHHLEGLIRQAVETQRASIADREQQLTVSCAPDLWIEADEVRLCQILQNLLSNACRYSFRGGHIQVEGVADGDAVVIRVIDDGRGIDPGRLDEIFGLFVQEHEGVAGLGLGLSLVQRLVDLHGGGVRAHSDGQGTGSTFEVRLPRAPGPKASDAPAPDGPATGEASPALRVLVIEDNPDVRELTICLLRAIGHTVFGAPDGPTGLSMAATERPDVALVDLSMPRMNGIEVAEEMHRRFGDQRPRLIALTGHGDVETQRKVDAAGFDTHLLKPVEPDVLEQALRS